MQKITSYCRKRALIGVAALALLAVTCSAKASSPFDGADPRDLIRTLKFLRSPDYLAAVPVIVPLLHDKNAGVIRDACRTLTVIGDSSVVPALESLLSDKRPDVRKDAQDAIDQLHSDHRPKYGHSTFNLATLRSKEIIRTLEMIRSPEFSAAVPAVMPLLHDERTEMVCEACRTLGIIANQDAIPAIELLLGDKRAEVRKSAREALDQLRAKTGGAHGNPPGRRP